MARGLHALLLEPVLRHAAQQAWSEYLERLSDPTLGGHTALEQVTRAATQQRKFGLGREGMVGFSYPRSFVSMVSLSPFFQRVAVYNELFHQCLGKHSAELLRKFYHGTPADRQQLVRLFGCIDALSVLQGDMSFLSDQARSLRRVLMACAHGQFVTILP